MVKKIIQGNVLSENKVIVNNSTLKGTLVQQGFGENKVNKLILDLFETHFLLANNKISVIDTSNKKVSAEDALAIGLKKDKRFYSKLVVYSDIREKGYCIKTGLKFGFDFRVYPKDKKMGEAHSEYAINVAPESEKLSMTQISRMSRLSGNIHTRLVQAVVDSENFVNYYEIKRILL